MTPKEAFRNYLKDALANKCKYANNQVVAILQRYDQSVIKHEPQRVFFDLIESYASEDAAKAIERVLQLANQQTVESNPLVRIKNHIAKLKAHVNKLDCEIVGVDRAQLAPHQLDSIQAARDEKQRVVPEVPKLAFDNNGNLLKPFYYTIVANYRGQDVPMEIAWTL
jgi:hypothetical protein